MFQLLKDVIEVNKLLQYNTVEKLDTQQFHIFHAYSDHSLGARERNDNKILRIKILSS
jgi:hypothetical protein